MAYMDCYNQATRRKVMQNVHGKDTAPELLVRRMLFRAGFRFRLHDARLPGKPDIILPKYKIVVFVNGCFWHRHPGCKHATMPATNQDYWIKKFQRNVERDADEIRQLESAGWKVFVIWECEIQTQTEFLITQLTAVNKSNKC